jgi:hypothetical protein
MYEEIFGQEIFGHGFYIFFLEILERDSKK